MIESRSDSTTRQCAAMLACAAAAVMLFGCATETLGTRAPGASGDPATIAASARLWGKIPDAMSPVVSIDSVDGQPTRASTSKIRVAPGHHTLTVTCRYGSLRKTRDMTLDAQAGGYYEVGIAADAGTASCEVAIRDLH